MDPEPGVGCFNPKSALDAAPPPPPFPPAWAERPDRLNLTEKDWRRIPRISNDLAAFVVTGGWKKTFYSLAPKPYFRESTIFPIFSVAPGFTLFRFRKIWPASPSGVRINRGISKGRPFRARNIAPPPPAGPTDRAFGAQQTPIDLAPRPAWNSRKTGGGNGARMTRSASEWPWRRILGAGDSQKSRGRLKSRGARVPSHRAPW